MTSMDDEQFGDLNYKNTIAEQVIALAKLAQEAGMDGVVATPLTFYSAFQMDLTFWQRQTDHIFKFFNAMLIHIFQNPM